MAWGTKIPIASRMGQAVTRWAQAWSADLHAIATLKGGGLLLRSSAGAWAFATYTTGLAALGIRVRRKTGDTTITNDVAVGAEADLTFDSLPAARYFYVRASIQVVAESTTPDLKVRWSVPANGSCRIGGGTPAAPGLAYAEGVESGSIPVQAVATGIVEVPFSGWLYTGDGGTFSFDWSQFTTSADDLTLKAGSIVMLVPVTT